MKICSITLLCLLTMLLGGGALKAQTSRSAVQVQLQNVNPAPNREAAKGTLAAIYYTPDGVPHLRLGTNTASDQEAYLKAKEAYITKRNADEAEITPIAPVYDKSKVSPDYARNKQNQKLPDDEGDNN